MFLVGKLNPTASGAVLLLALVAGAWAAETNQRATARVVHFDDAPEAPAKAAITKRASVRIVRPDDGEEEEEKAAIIQQAAVGIISPDDSKEEQANAAINQQAAIGIVSPDDNKGEQAPTPINQQAADKFADPGVAKEGKAPLDENRFPYFGRITRSGTVVCGSVLVTEDVILTATSCLSDTLLSSLTVRFDSDVRSIVNRKLHSYSGVALGKLDQPVYGVSIPMVGGGGHGDLKVMGFGSLSNGGPVSNYLQGFTVKALSNWDCTRAIGWNLFPTQMCGDAQGFGACNGDKGGPLIRQKGSAGSDRVVGIVSRPHCGNGMPDIYFRVNHYWSWINSRMYGW